MAVVGNEKAVWNVQLNDILFLTCSLKFFITMVKKDKVSVNYQ